MTETEADDCAPPDVTPKRGPGRPRKEQKAEPATVTVRISQDLLEKLNAYQEQADRKVFISHSRADLLDDAWAEFVRRQAKEPPDLKLLTGGERQCVTRFLHYLTRTPPTNQGRRTIMKIVAEIDELIKLIQKLERKHRDG